MRRWIVAALLSLMASAASADTCAHLYGKGHLDSSDGEWRLAVDSETMLHRQATGPQATLYRKKGPIWRRRARWTFLNSPAQTFLTRDGMTVTLDTGCHMGYGDHVVVIYRPDGSVLRKLGLKDFLVAEDIESFPRTVSSIRWAGTHRIDEEKRQIILQVKGQPQMVEVPISLDDGTPLVPKKRYFERSFLSASVSYKAAPDELAEVQQCDHGVAVSTRELLSLVAEPIFPAFPPVALKARVSGSIVLEVSVNENGMVDSAAVIKPLPFGLDAAALAAARQWRFRPAQREGQSVPMCGRFSMTFGLTPVDPAMAD